MSGLAVDLARAIDPVALAGAIGMTPDDWQTGVLRSDHPRILLNCCRQSGKSTTCAVKAVHVACYEAGALILCLSPSQRQSGELFKKITAVYRALGRPVAAESESALTLTLENGSRIVTLPGSEATIRAFSAVRLIIVDEAARVDDDTIAAVRPMLAVSAGQMIALSTPFGRRGWWFEAWEHGGAIWERVRVPATEVARISPAFLEEERQALGPWAFAQEYECAFGDASAAAFSTEDIENAFREDVETWAL